MVRGLVDGPSRRRSPRREVKVTVGGHLPGHGRVDHGTPRGQRVRRLVEVRCAGLEQGKCWSYGSRGRVRGEVTSSQSPSRVNTVTGTVAVSHQQAASILSLTVVLLRQPCQLSLALTVCSRSRGHLRSLLPVKP